MPSSPPVIAAASDGVECQPGENSRRALAFIGFKLLDAQLHQLIANVNDGIDPHVGLTAGCDPQATG